MTLHKLTAGDGYTYLTRQVAAHDADQRGYGSLGDYYAEKGESPGEWVGRGWSDLPQFLGGVVTEAQMRALFGEGRHPDAERIEAEMIAAGHGAPAILAATRLGSPFKRCDDVSEFRRAVAAGFADYNAARGVPRDWPVPAEVRASIRTDIARAMFSVEHGREPADPRELSGFLARISRQATTSVAGYDLTFSPVKSVSALWALAPRTVAEQIERAHRDAVTDTLTWLEKNATYTRLGRGGVQQVEVTGLIAAAFTHRDSRAGDPDLHTHVAISNKVQSVQDGRWLALDGRPLHKMTVAASERYNTRLEAHLTARLGIRFAERAGSDPAKRPVREVVGIDERITALWSRRRAEIEVRRATLSAAFQSEHGRPPTTVEAIALAQQANLETRKGKHAPKSRGEQRTNWWAEAVSALGDELAIARMLRAVLDRRVTNRAPELTPEWIARAAERVLQRVQTGRATWQECHVRAEAERYVRAAGICIRQVDAVVDRIVGTALSPANSTPLGVPDTVTEPTVLRRHDGRSVYETVGTQLYTASVVLEAEAALLSLARQDGARTLTAEQVDVALLEATANGVTLNPGQAQLVRELACSGARLQLALAPAGTGKTTAMRVLTRAWQTPDSPDNPAGHVLGLAPSAAAAAVLREEIGVHTDTLAKLLHALDDVRTELPAWAAAVGPGSLVIIDEAGMAGTTDLARATHWITARGGVVRLIGDDQQLASVAAGGVLRDIAADVGAVQLSQVMRFTDPAEGAASLALRAGDTAAIGYYIDHGRVHVGDESTVTDTAYTAWATDRAAGLDTIMIAPTRDLVASLNARARTDRLIAIGSLGAEVRLADGSTASAGDVILSRRNDRRLPITATDFVKNGDRWTISTVHPDGSLHVVHHGTRRTITLPDSYVREHVVLGYATTVHTAQGITADTSHLVATGTETRQLLYVALTRGRTANHVYLTTADDGDPHTVITRDALLPPTATDILARIITRDGAQTSATTAGRDLADPATRLRDAAARYHDALLVAAESHLGTDRLDALNRAAEAVLPGLTTAESWPTLRAHLALLNLDGHDTTATLQAAVALRPLDSARDIAAVLDWRLDPTGRRGEPGPLPWLPGIPSALATDPDWGHYLDRRVQLVTEIAPQVAAQPAQWAPTQTPAWATGLHERDPELTAAIAVWRAANGIDDTETEPTGPPRPWAAEARHQHALNQRIDRVRGDRSGDSGRFRALADSLDPRIASDPYWPQLAERLSAARRAGIDIGALVMTVANKGALPDEYPAAALWWRLSRHLSPAAVTGDHATVSTLRPHWTNDLTTVLGIDAAKRVLADPAWPALVAAVTDATDDGWQPTTLLATAYELLESGHPAEEPLRDDELATALVWRIGMLTDEPTTHDTTPRPSHTATEPASVREFEDAWFASLTEPDDAPPFEPQAHEVHEPSPLEHAGEDRVPAAAMSTNQPNVGVLRARLVELNRQAADFYAKQYDNSWARRYVADRFGHELATEARDRYQPGYAPAGWTRLIDQLHRLGATDTELLEAGLAVRTRTGRLIDRFRDRLVLPIWNRDEVHAFTARRHPDAADDAGPKYLNTAETALFTKGNQLYGLHETRDLLAASSTPVLVEGPFDAWAITLAGRGHFVGLAPLGTAFTDRQADQLKPWIGAGKPGVIVATDNDPAGRQAAERAFWQLTARGDTPRHLALPDGLDPAQLLHRYGATALHDALTNADSLATRLVDQHIDRYAGRLDSVEGTVHAARTAAHIIGATRPENWIALAAYAETRLPEHTRGLVLFETVEAGQAWTDDPFTRARERITTTHQNASAAERWAALGRSIHPDLITAREWIPLADALDRAHAAGHDLATELPRLAAAAPLPYRSPAAELRRRVIAEWPDTIAEHDKVGVSTGKPSRTSAPQRPSSAARRTLDQQRDRTEPPKQPPGEPPPRQQPTRSASPPERQRPAPRR
jgi:DNA primase catalytic core